MAQFTMNLDKTGTAAESNRTKTLEPGTQDR